MKIKIFEVWNGEGKSEELTTIEIPNGSNPKRAVWDWIFSHRPDLNVANGLTSHGFYAREA